MARRHQDSARKGGDADDRQGSVERLLEKGSVKEAFKQAKLYFHQDASPENRLLVERTYLRRIQSLIKGGMPSAGQEVAQSMLEFGLRDPGLLREAILLLPQVGLADRALALQGQSGSPDLQALLLPRLADRAVLHPEEAAAPELSEAASRVRQALESLEAGNDAQALELLQPIPRSSPMADWRYFVRGLSAYRHDDLEQAKVNWDRLDENRAARKISSALLAASVATPADGSHEHLKSREIATFGEQVLDRISEYRLALDAGDWKRVLRLTAPLRRTLQRIDPRCSQRLTEIVLMPLSSEVMQLPKGKADRLLADFKSALEPPAWDPRWNRFDALLWEGPQGDSEYAVRHWQKYLKDLEGGVAGLPGESRLVQALVWRRIGKILSQEADLDLDEMPAEPQEGAFVSNDYAKKAVEAFRQSLLLDPRQKQTHQLLIESYAEWNMPVQEIAALGALLEAFPDDADALKQLIELHRLRDEPEPVLRYVERLRAVRPLDTQIAIDEVWGRFALARHLALKGRWEEGRAEFARLGTLVETKDELAFSSAFARKAVFEFKAGDKKLAEEIVAKTIAAIGDPAAFCLALAIESIRYELPKAMIKRFDKEFESELAKKVSSPTAGKLARLLGAYLLSGQDYPGRAGHVDSILGYLKRTSRLKYTEGDLRIVCATLKMMAKDDAILVPLLKRGVKLFPKSPFFLLMQDDIERIKALEKFGGVLPKLTKLNKALLLAEASQEPEDAKLVPVIRKKLADAEDEMRAFDSFPAPFGFPGMPRGKAGASGDGPPGFAEFMENLGKMDFDFGFDDEPEPSPAKRPPRRK